MTGYARPARPAFTVLHNSPAAERAAQIDREDAARDAMHAVPHSALGAVGTIMRARAHLAPPLTDFGDDEP
jgi:hypothetical protein